MKNLKFIFLLLVSSIINFACNGMPAETLARTNRKWTGDKVDSAYPVHELTKTVKRLGAERKADIRKQAETRLARSSRPTTAAYSDSDASFVSSARSLSSRASSRASTTSAVSDRLKKLRSSRSPSPGLTASSPSPSGGRTYKTETTDFTETHISENPLLLAKARTAHANDFNKRFKELETCEQENYQPLINESKVMESKFKKLADTSCTIGGPRTTVLKVNKDQCQKAFTDINNLSRDISYNLALGKIRSNKINAVEKSQRDAKSGAKIPNHAPPFFVRITTFALKCACNDLGRQLKVAKRRLNKFEKEIVAAKKVKTTQ